MNLGARFFLFCYQHFLKTFFRSTLFSKMILTYKLLNLERTLMYQNFLYDKVLFDAEVAEKRLNSTYKTSRSAHRTPNFTNPDFFVYLLFEHFFQMKALNQYENMYTQKCQYNS